MKRFEHIHIFVFALSLTILDTGCTSSSSNKQVADDDDTDSIVGTNMDESTDSSQNGTDDTSVEISTDKEGKISYTVEKAEIGNQIFNDDTVLSYHLNFSDEALEELMDMSTLVDTVHFSTNKDRYVPAHLSVEDTSIASVGVRFKGDWSITSCAYTGQRVSRVEPVFGDIDVCQRFSLKLDINKYDDEARLDGLKKINLHAMSTDPTKMHERLGYSLFREMDIVTPRAAHARVYINGVYHGLFLAVEQVDGRFTANRYPEYGDGNLIKQVWPTEEVSETGVVEGLKTNDDDPSAIDVSGFMNFRDAIVTANEAGNADTLSSYVDFDYLARYIVVDRAITNFDGIFSFYGGDYGNHNYYWYQEEESGRFTLIPWDLDKVFMVPEPNFWFNNEPDSGSDYIPTCIPMNSPNWNVISSSCEAVTCSFDTLNLFTYQLTPLDCDPLLNLTRQQIYDSQAQIAEAFIAGPFSQERIENKVDTWKAQIITALDEDELVDRAAVETAIDKLYEKIPALQNNLAQMMSGLIEQE